MGRQVGSASMRYFAAIRVKMSLRTLVTFASSVAESDAILNATISRVRAALLKPRGNRSGYAKTGT